MSDVVAGVDFGTQSVRVSIVDSERGPIGAGVAEYPVKRDKRDPDFATQSHASHMKALAEATRAALKDAAVDGDAVRAIALDTTGSTVIPVDDRLEPLDDYYLWCDHRAKDEAEEITAAARASNLPAIDWCGGVYSSEWGFAKLLHWLRHNPDRRERFATALEHCDMVAAALSGISDPSSVSRSVCAMGHKWLWSEQLGGLPSEEFLTKVDPLFAGVRTKLDGNYRTSDHVAGRLDPVWAERLGLRAGIPIPVGAFDAHWDAIGAGVTEGAVVNVIGTSTCMIAISKSADCVPGVCGVVPGSVHPDFVGVEAGLSAVGDIFEAIASRANTSVAELSSRAARHRAGQTGLLRMAWDNGDRTVLVNASLGGVTFGWNLSHTAEDELFAAIEGTALHTRIILDRMRDHGVPIERVIHGGGIPQKNELLNQVYANVLDMPVLVPERSITSLGSAIFAFLAAGTFATIEEAQRALCPSYRVVEPRADESETYELIYPLYRDLYFSLGQRDSSPVSIGNVLPALRKIAADVRGNLG
ncbi:MAG TPA: ribulokinase [Gemmatimonadaceae bacterium]|nr:ribulokinase [Gemmatimonadaceae bacterium]